MLEMVQIRKESVAVRLTVIDAALIALGPKRVPGLLVTALSYGIPLTTTSTPFCIATVTFFGKNLALLSK